GGDLVDEGYLDLRHRGATATPGKIATTRASDARAGDPGQGPAWGGDHSGGHEAHNPSQHGAHGSGWCGLGGPGWCCLRGGRGGGASGEGDGGGDGDGGERAGPRAGGDNGAGGGPAPAGEPA